VINNIIGTVIMRMKYEMITVCKQFRNQDKFIGNKWDNKENDC